jgi:sarcosine oxidase
MSARTFDAAVIGVGAMGSATCLHLARAGLRVLGLEQFGIPNTRGSSHGATRILRLGLHESATYVPIVRRALELWLELGEAAGRPVYHAIGSLDISRPEAKIFRGSLASCERCDIAHQVLDATEVQRRFPALRPDSDMLAVHQPGSGFLEPEYAISAHADQAIAHGAEIHGHERLVGWEPISGGGYRLTTDRGTYEAGQLLFTTGAWLGKLLGVPVEPERTVLGWFSTGRHAEHFTPGRLPVWILDSEECGHFYGFPAHGIPGFKLGRLREIAPPAVDPDAPRREPDAEDEADMRQFVRRYFPAANGPVLSMSACFFENTPDRAPLIGPVPGAPGCWMLGGFSGHGFKYSSAIGEAAKDLVLGNTPRFSLDPFRTSRFAAA